MTPVSSDQRMRPLVPSSLTADWRRGVTYQLYVRSFSDGNGDGVGDIPGAIARLPYIKSLGVDSVWVSPWYVSPMADGGYDVADYCDIEPMFGTLDDADQFIKECHRLDLRVMVDVVVNHCSCAHPWFQRALRAGTNSPEREFFYFRDGRGPRGDEPPTDWVSVFGGPAWTRVTESDGTPGQWYLHLFDSAQPDLNWHNPAVRLAFDEIFRFWFDRGVDGFRLDAVPAIGKEPEFRDAGCDPTQQFAPETNSPTSYWDSGDVHEIVAHWRALADSYSPPKYLVGEINVSTTEALLRYVRPGELHSVFAMNLAKLPWSARQFRHRIDQHLSSFYPDESWLTWVSSSHDEVRTVTRYAQGDEEHSDPALGVRRAKAALLMTLALPGGACLYQGEELGLPQVTDIPVEMLEDPIVLRTGDPSKGRDGCRVALPWTLSGPSFGFSVVAPRVAQPTEWTHLSVESQEQDRNSFLHFTRRVLHLRRHYIDDAVSDMEWLDWSDDIVAFERGRLRCVINFSDVPFALASPGRIAVMSETSGSGWLAPNSGAWLWI